MQVRQRSRGNLSPVVRARTTIANRTIHLFDPRVPQERKRRVIQLPLARRIVRIPLRAPRSPSPGALASTARDRERGHPGRKTAMNCSVGVENGPDRTVGVSIHRPPFIHQDGLWAMPAVRQRYASIVKSKSGRMRIPEVSWSSFCYFRAQPCVSRRLVPLSVDGVIGSISAQGGDKREREHAATNTGRADGSGVRLGV